MTRTEATVVMVLGGLSNPLIDVLAILENDQSASDRLVVGGQEIDDRVFGESGHIESSERKGTGLFLTMISSYHRPI